LPAWQGLRKQSGRVRAFWGPLFHSARTRLDGVVWRLVVAVLALWVAHWSLTSLREELVKIGAKIVTHARYVTFQLAKVAVTHDLFRKILRLIDELRPPPTPA